VNLQTIIFLIALKFKSCGDQHDGPISALSLSPFNKELFLTVGGNVFCIWRDGIKVWNLVRLFCANLLEVHSSRDTYSLQFIYCTQIVKLVLWIALSNRYCFLQNVPVLWRRSYVMLTSGSWSLFCPSMLYLTRVDGTVEVWDFLVRSDKPVLVQSISGSALTGV
jgi:WD40 repeat protein